MSHVAPVRPMVTLDPLGAFWLVHEMGTKLPIMNVLPTAHVGHGLVGGEVMVMEDPVAVAPVTVTVAVARVVLFTVSLAV